MKQCERSQPDDSESKAEKWHSGSWTVKPSLKPSGLHHAGGRFDPPREFPR